jgi:L-serine dehydratase
MAVSVFDLFKIGIGPSSSHTVGPMRAARLFALRLAHEALLARTSRITCELYGSLAATGKGHGSDKAVLLGLAGHEPDTVDVEAIPAILASIREARRLNVLGRHDVAFDEAADLRFLKSETLPFHANGLRFTAWDAGASAPPDTDRRPAAAAGVELLSRVYYSVGGGFVVSDDVAADGSKQRRIAPEATILPLPFRSGAELLALAAEHRCTIAQVMRRNERHWRTDADIDSGLLRIWQVMQDCVVRGCRAEGVLPGGFKVKRRSARPWRRPASAITSRAGWPGSAARDADRPPVQLDAPSGTGRAWRANGSNESHFFGAYLMSGGATDFLTAR